MQSSKKILKGLCIKNREASQCCFNQKCQNSALRCSDLNCQCHVTHKKCKLTLHFQSILQQFQTQSRNFNSQYLLLIQWCQNSIKHLTTLIQQTKHSFDTQPNHVNENYRQLYLLLNQQKYNEIKSPLISSIVASKDDEQQNNSIKSKLDKLSEDIEEIIKKAEKVIDQKQNQKKHISHQLTFSKQLKHASIELINQKTIRLPKCQSNYFASLFSSSIQELKNHQKHKFIIKKNASQIQFGLSYLQTIKQKEFELSTSEVIHKQIGYLLYINSQYLYYSGDKNMKNRFQIKQNQVLEIEINISQRQLIFRNTSNNHQTEIRFQIKPNNPLYLCVVLNQQNSQVQYLGME